jgi:hypothetical protein
MSDSLLEYVKELNEDRSKLLSLDDVIYRSNILEKMRNKDENIKEMYADKLWAEKITKQGMTIILIDEYLEKMLRDIMDTFNEENDFIDMFKEWEGASEEFKMANVYAEELVTEEEWDEGVEKFNNLLKIYADKTGLSGLRAKLKMPPFDNVFDKIEWLEHEMDTTNIDEILKEAIDKEASLSCSSEDVVEFKW